MRVQKTKIAPKTWSCGSCVNFVDDATNNLIHFSKVFPQDGPIVYVAKTSDDMRQAPSLITPAIADSI